MVLVGEAPGNEEDKRGRPFVGPAGLLLDEALDADGIMRSASVGNIVATYHPSALLRAPDADTRLQIRQALIDDLCVAARVAGTG